MPRRSSVVRVKTPKLQGDDSWVQMAALKVREIREYRKLAEEKDEDGNEVFDAFEGGVDILKAHILAWNWVDDDGNPLDQVPDNPKVVDELTNDESLFLSNLLLEGPPDEESPKNSNGG